MFLMRWKFKNNHELVVEIFLKKKQIRKKNMKKNKKNLKNMNESGNENNIWEVQKPELFKLIRLSQKIEFGWLFDSL